MASDEHRVNTVTVDLHETWEGDLHFGVCVNRRVGFMCLLKYARQKKSFRLTVQKIRKLGDKST